MEKLADISTFEALGNAGLGRGEMALFNAPDDIKPESKSADGPLDYVAQMKEAGNTLIEFFNNAISTVQKHRQLEQDYKASKASYYEVLDKVDWAVELYSAVLNDVELKMGPDKFMADEQMKEIRKAVSEKEQQFRGVIG